MKSAVKYGLENLNKVQEAISLGFANSQTDNTTITVPKALAVIN